MAGIIFPSVTGKNLLRQTINFPDDLPEKLNILLLAFYQSQQMDINTWLPFVQQLEDQFDGVSYFELPVIYEMGRVRQFLLNEGMRAGIPDPKSRLRTITLYLDKDTFLSQLEIASESDIQILLVAQNGEVVWRTTGRLTPVKESTLRQELEKRLSAGNS